MTSPTPLHDDHDAQLQKDVRRMIERSPRRAFLQLMMCAAAAPLVAACRQQTASARSDSDDSDDTDDADTDAGASDDALEETAPDSCAQIPEETAGPYPGDGSNGPNALALSGIVRSDITSSIASARGVAEGVPLTVKLKLVNVADGCTPMAGYAVYLWHCDREGRYSLYSSGVTGENYLRGVQEADEDGVVTFETIFPGCYAGRMPHIHFEVYAGLDQTSSSKNKVATSQLAFPVSDCQAVYAEEGYTSSVRNLSAISFASDNVFSDGHDTQLATMRGSVGEGYVATLTVGVSD
ncbi:MAG: intradiol ring-cleavage dioxygenase [Polyangiales bacterium]